MHPTHNTEKESMTSYVDMANSRYSKCLYNSLYHNGFAILKNHNVDFTIIEDIYDSWEIFFSGSVKHKYIRSDATDEGYVPMNTERAAGCDVADQKEFFQTHINGIYPDIPQIEITKKLILNLISIGEKAISSIDEHLPGVVKSKMSSSLNNMIHGCDRHGFRVVHYPGVENKNLPRAAAHGDICLLTLLPRPTGEGLSLMNRNGVWVTPKLSENDIIIFNSDMLSMCTDNYFNSTTHKVSINRSIKDKDSRYSMPVFIHPKREILLSENLSALNALRERLKKIGFKGDLLKF